MHVYIQFDACIQFNACILNSMHVFNSMHVQCMYIQFNVYIFNHQRWSRGHKARGQGQGQTLSRPRPRTKDTDASVLKKKGLQSFFSGEKGLQKIFFRRSLLEETKKKVFADFPQGF